MPTNSSSRSFPPHGFGGHGPFGPGFGPFPPGFGPFGPAGGRRKKGDVPGAILSLLSGAPSNGYGLIKAIAEKTGGVWKPSPGSVYPTLQQLVDESLIEQVDPAASRSDYQLTDAGRVYVVEHAEELRSAWGSAEQTWDEHGELFASVAKLLIVIRQHAATGTKEQREEAIEKIDELRRELYRILGD